MNSPFNETRYRGLLGGLEISEVRFYTVNTNTLRYDSEYYQKAHLVDAKYIVKNNKEFCSFQDLGIAIDASAFYPSIENFYDTGELPFLRVADVDSIINFEKCTHIPEELCNQFPTLAKIRRGDIVLTKGGSVARVGLITEEAAVSRDLIFLNSSKLPEEDQVFIYLYCQTDFFNRALIRSSSQTAQPHLTITLVRDLLVFIASKELKDICLTMVHNSFDSRKRAIEYQDEAEHILLHALGLENWQSLEPLTYTRTCKDAFAAGRLDAEHFQEHYFALTKKLKDFSGGWMTLGDLCPSPTNGAEIREYVNEGVPYLRVGDLSNFDIDLASVVYVDEAEAQAVIKKVALIPGDVLVSRSGSLAVTGVVESEWKHSLISSHLIRVRLDNCEYDPYYVALFLSTLPGKWQIEQWSNGGVQPEINQPSLKSIIIPKLGINEQIKIKQTIIDGRIARKQAKNLLEFAKRAVEIAIEDSETAALSYLESTTTMVPTPERGNHQP